MSKKATIKKLTTSLLQELRGGSAVDAAPKGGKGKPKAKPKPKPLTSGQVGALDGATNSATAPAVPSTKKAGPSTPFTCNTHCYTPKATE